MSNLLLDDWLTIKRKSGRREKISLHDITSAHADEIVDIDAPRADFKGAIYQLLIGLLQCNFAPADRRAWQRYWQQPPSAEQLQKAFAPIAHLFEICPPDGPAFMQDLQLTQGAENSVEQLLIDTTESHYNKPGRVAFISPYWAAIALFTLQINAPSGGRGHRVSLRGGGPLTTLVLPPALAATQSLWHCLWLNVLTQDEFSQLQGNHERDTLADIYPWAGATRTSEQPGSEMLPELAHPLHMYWSMPRRIRLGSLQARTAVCDLSGEPLHEGISSYITKSHGFNYSGAWLHPLTPYIDDPANPPPLSIKGQPGGLGYRHWLGTVLNTHNPKRRQMAARVAQQYSAQRRDWIEDFAEEDLHVHPRLWLFGYDMDNMKARCWYENTLPLMAPEPERHDDVIESVQIMINAAQDARKTLISAVKKAWFRRPKDAKGNIRNIDQDFWQQTQENFYQCLQKVIANQASTAYSHWHKSLIHQAHALFELYTIHDAAAGADFARVIHARDGKDGLQHSLNKSAALKQLKKAGAQT